MMTNKKTYFELKGEIKCLEIEIQKKKNALTNSIAYFFVSEVDKKTEVNFFITENELCNKLAEELLERDEPMSYADIKEVFNFSGWNYKEEHILLARPDSQAVIDEQIAYYRD